MGRFHVAHPQPPPAALSVCPCAGATQATGGCWTADCSPGRQLKKVAGTFAFQSQLWSFSFLTGRKPSFRPVRVSSDACDSPCSGPPASCHSHTPSRTPYCRTDEPSKTDGIMLLKTLPSSPVPTKEIPNFLAWHSMLSTALPQSAFPESSPASPTNPQPPYSPAIINHTILHQAINSYSSVPLHIAVIPHLAYLPNNPYLLFLKHTETKLKIFQSNMCTRFTYLNGAEDLKSKKQPIVFLFLLPIASPSIKSPFALF